ncbi:MAG: hypothetical protein WDN08_09770 [Rhizomicrobium sp.]
MLAFPVKTDKEIEETHHTSRRMVWSAPHAKKTPVSETANFTHPLGGPDFGAYAS